MGTVKETETETETMAGTVAETVAVVMEAHRILSPSAVPPVPRHSGAVDVLCRVVVVVGRPAVGAGAARLFGGVCEESRNSASLVFRCVGGSCIVRNMATVSVRRG